MANNIGKNIAEMRKALGRTQENLAEAVGVSGQAVSKWEGGGTPDVELLVPIADYFGVSIDKLFGRNVNDYGDMLSEAAKFIASQERDKSVSKAFEMCCAVEMGLMGHKDIEPHLSLDSILEKDHGYVHSQVLTEQGSIMAALRKDLQYFMLMPEPAAGWLARFSDHNVYNELFRTLADPDTLKTLYLLYSRSNNKPFTPKMLEKELGISVEIGSGILENLAKYNFIHTSEIELDDTIQKVYHFDPNPAFIAVLALCTEIIKKPNKFYGAYLCRQSPYFKK